MAFRKLANPVASNLDNATRVHGDQGFCCADSKKEVKTYSNTAHNLSTGNIDRIVIDGTTYPFDAAASTQAALVDSINKAFKSAFYTEVAGLAVTVSGAVTATVVSIKTTADVTKMITSGDADVNLSAS